jgi:AcrR family transcriptional regulator
MTRESGDDVLLIDYTTQSKLRDEYLQRLRDLVREHGIDGLTTDRISAYLKCSKATLYAIWRHKDHLISEVVESLLCDIEEESRDRADRVRDPAAKVSEYLAVRAAGLTVLDDRCRRGRVVNPGVSQAYATAQEASSHWLCAYLRHGVDNGSFRRVDTRFVEGVTAFLSERIRSGELPRRAGISAARATQELTSLIASALTNQE